MLDLNKIVDLLIQEKFLQAIEAKKEGKLYNLKQELRDELKSREQEIKNISQEQWNSAEKLLKEM